MTARIEFTYLSDDEVEEYFDLTVSKLRTAQRLGLVSASQGQKNRRQTRLWSAEDVLRVWVVEIMVRYTGIPFGVVAGMFAAAPEYRWEGLVAAVFHGGPENVVARVSVVNRTTVTVEYPGDSLIVAGRIEVDTSGRSYFQPGRRHFEGDFRDLAAPDYPTSYIFYDPVGAVRSFRELFTEYRRLTRRD